VTVESMEEEENCFWFGMRRGIIIVQIAALKGEVVIVRIFFLINMALSVLLRHGQHTFNVLAALRERH